MQNEIQHLNPEQIASIADAINNNTYEQLPKGWRMHLTECDQCAEEVINVAELSSDTGVIEIPFKNNDTPQVPRTLRGNNTKVLFGVAAAAAIIAFALILNIPWNNETDLHDIQQNQELAKSDKNEIKHTASDSTDSKTKTQNEEPTLAKVEVKERKDKTDTKAKNNKLLAYYEPNPKLERMYKNMQGGYRGESIEVITNAEMQYKKGAVLEWENPDRNTLYVEIFNNNGEEVRRKITTENKYELPELNPGLYYWKLIGENFDLLFIGKIIVK
ncbi:hypothetical protein L21SP5_00986 [Salinivirga cyanobacteriivorans]|uniref:Uncharacterized protein n=1 Tax=Salinivirga cyanobacteriivorans TaxID=1307839 RepID=A0A0S2HX88_9BACT|nr:hypothetical protein [Salinivirga cyanobacteriivorans]ALO14653.1 hypothetical protein L21SP5_00986 [Salinivirga cyanobacteriivorans]